uniref:UBA domain-containing protein n=1 Tax=Cyprinus carpio carpio TaxID=630221 RepID=A0A9J8A2Y7_CYPCA
MESQQEVNPVFLQQLRELDIPEEAAKQALLHTQNVSAEEAAMYYFNKLENEEEGDEDLMFKMVFVVNMELSMGVGKPDDPSVAARISACLTDISCWMKDHHLQLNLAKTELLVVSANPLFHHNFTIKLGTSTITPSKTARNLGVMIDDQLTFSDHIAKTVLSCRFALFNIKKIRPFLYEHAAQLLVQALVLSRLDYCSALLAGLPASSIKPLQLIQNATARLIFNEPKRIHVSVCTGYQ